MITFGIYAIVWYVKTKEEMNSAGADIPTAWLPIVPIANIYWIWKWCEGIGKVTRDDLSPVVALLLIMFLGPIGMAVIQSSLNKKALPVGVTPAAAY